MNHSLLPRPGFWLEAGLQKRTKFSLFGELMIFMLVYFIAQLIESFVSSVPLTCYILFSGAEEIYVFAENGTIDLYATVINFLEAMPDWATAVMLLSSVVFIGAAIFYCRKIEKRSLGTMGLRGGKPLLEFALGLAIGFVLFLAVAGLGSAVGAFRIGSFSFRREGLPLLLLFALGFLVQGAGEELMVRGYLATSLGARLPVPTAVICSSLMFTTLHSGNVNFTFLAAVNIFLAGTVFCIYMIKRGSIWGVCAMHAMWNFTQGCVFSFPVSGVPAGSAMFVVKTDASNALLTGGGFGPEASICTTVVLLAALGAVLALRAKDPAPEAPEDMDSGSGPEQE